jgi:hypothetical protein
MRTYIDLIVREARVKHVKRDVQRAEAEHVRESSANAKA